MRVVLDCNVLISAVLGSAICRQVLLAAVSRHTIIYSQPTLTEFLEVAQRKHLHLDPTKVEHISHLILGIGCEVTPAEQDIELPDRDDAVYLQTAIAGQAAVLITGNTKHFPLGDYHGVQILSPREFLDRQDRGKAKTA